MFDRFVARWGGRLLAAVRYGDADDAGFREVATSALWAAAAIALVLAVGFVWYLMLAPPPRVYFELKRERDDRVRALQREIELLTRAQRNETGSSRRSARRRRAFLERN
jgi:hypothetical protein